MNEPVTRDGSRFAIVTSLALCVLSLGIPWSASAPGYRTDARVFLAAAIAFLALALGKRATSPATAGTAVTGALVALATVLALGIRTIEPEALMVTVGTIVLLLDVRFTPRRRADRAR